MSASREYAEAVSAFERERAGRLRRARLRRMAGCGVSAAVIFSAAYANEVSALKLLEGLPEILNYFRRLAPELHIGTIAEDLGDWFWALPKWLSLLRDVLLIALLSTAMASLLALILCFPASRNLGLGRYPAFLLRSACDIARSIPEIVLAMILVVTFGIGPLAGVLALTLHSTTVLVKLFSEAVENLDGGSVESVVASGGTRVQTIALGALPQLAPQLLSYSLYRFEVNVRAATVIGFVGAGGIGQELIFVVRQFLYADISAIVLLIVATVVVIDLSCERARHWLIGREGMR